MTMMLAFLNLFRKTRGVQKKAWWTSRTNVFAALIALVAVVTKLGLDPGLSETDLGAVADFVSLHTVDILGAIAVIVAWLRAVTNSSVGTKTEKTDT